MIRFALPSLLIASLAACGGSSSDDWSDTTPSRLDGTYKATLTAASTNSTSGACQLASRPTIDVEHVMDADSDAQNAKVRLKDSYLGQIYTGTLSQRGYIAGGRVGEIDELKLIPSGPVSGRQAAQIFYSNGYSSGPLTSVTVIFADCNSVYSGTVSSFTPKR